MDARFKVDAMRSRTTPHLARRLVSEVSNWYTAGLMTAIVLPTRVPPRRGLGGTWLARQVVKFRLRDGSVVRCRLLDAGAVLDVYVEAHYDVPGISWSQLRTVLDVGAHVGAFTVWAARRSPAAKIVALEPNLAVLEFLRQNIAGNELANRVEVVESAIGGVSGTGSFEVSQFSTASRLNPRADGELVRVATISEILDAKGIDTLDLLKLDCEGAEYDALLSASQQLLRRIGVVLCEYHPAPIGRLNELQRRLSGSGFVVRMSEGADGQGILVAQRASDTLTVESDGLTQVGFRQADSNMV